MSTEEGRLLGLDLGETRVGVALSDPLGITAQPFGRLDRRATPKLVDAIREIVREHGVTRIVVGLPLRLSGDAGPEAADAEAFGRRLRAAIPGVAVDLWDERLTTAEVERMMIDADVSRRKRKRKVDTLAAVVILQSYMDSRVASVEDER